MRPTPDELILSEEEQEIYNRQIFFMGAKNQKTLKSKKVFTLGAGGLGSPILYYLAAAGVGEIVICDYDVVERSNLNRQILHNLSRIGQNKAESAKGTLLELNRNISVSTITQKLSQDELSKEVDDCDLIIDATDSMPYKEKANRIFVSQGKPCIYGILLGFAGFCLLTGAGSPCLSCLFKKAPVYATGRALPFKHYPSFGASAGCLGSLMANVAVRHLLGYEESVTNRIFYLSQLLPFKQLMLSSRGLKAIMTDHFKNSFVGTSRAFPENNTMFSEHIVPPNPDCKICQGHKTPSLKKRQNHG